ncbi:MAG TPA: hypothetical protein VFU02_13605 [Polyangiaceae bacterium]|nr:hypothetical protein [Polyangiaceae bacterium]
MMWVKLGLVVVGFSFGVGCENKFRQQRAPTDLGLPQPDRGPCAKQPPPVLFVRLPRFMRDDMREKRYCAPLDEFLKARQLGSASKKAPPPRDDRGFSGCAVHAPDVDRTLPLLKSELLKLKVPERTVIEELCTGVGSVHVVR